MRIVCLKGQTSLNGMEGHIVSYINTSARWQVNTAHKTLCVKSTNIEAILTPKPQLLARFQQAASLFQYDNDIATRTVFDRVWDRASNDGDHGIGGVEQLIDDLCSNEVSFDQIYSAMLA